MKLQKLAGYGPLGAYLSGVALSVILLLLYLGPGIFGQNLGLQIALSIVLVLATTAWLMGLLVVGFDLEWLEHPKTHTGRVQAALVASVIAAFVPPLFAVIFLFNPPPLIPFGIIAVLGACLGLFLVIQNFEARRAGILHGALPVIGVASGAGFLLMSLGLVLMLVSPNFGLLALLGWLLGGICCVFWSIWLGTKAARLKQAPGV